MSLLILLLLLVFVITKVFIYNYLILVILVSVLINLLLINKYRCNNQSKCLVPEQPQKPYPSGGECKKIIDLFRHLSIGIYNNSSDNYGINNNNNK